MIDSPSLAHMNGNEGMRCTPTEAWMVSNTSFPKNKKLNYDHELTIKRQKNRQPIMRVAEKL